MGRMDQKTKVFLNGEWVTATLVPVTSTQEGWSQYLLEDGSVVKVKIVVTEVAKVDGRYEPDGTPIYSTKWNLVLAVTAPEELKKTPGV